MNSPPPPPGYGTLPPDPNEPPRLPYPTGPPSPTGPTPMGPLPHGMQYGQGPYGHHQNHNARYLGIASLTTGILGLPFSCCCFFIAWILPLVALVTGIVSLSQASKDPRSDAKPFALAGIALGAVGLVLTVVFLLVGALMDPSTFE